MSLSRTAIDAALSTVIDPEIRKPITEVGMVKGVEISDKGVVPVGVFLNISA